MHAAFSRHDGRGKERKDATNHMLALIMSRYQLEIVSGGRDVKHIQNLTDWQVGNASDHWYLTRIIALLNKLRKRTIKTILTRFRDSSIYES